MIFGPVKEWSRLLRPKSQKNSNLLVSRSSPLFFTQQVKYDNHPFKEQINTISINVITATHIQMNVTGYWYASKACENIPFLTSEFLLYSPFKVGLTPRSITRIQKRNGISSAPYSLDKVALLSLTTSSVEKRKTERRDFHRKYFLYERNKWIELDYISIPRMSGYTYPTCWYTNDT